MFVLIGYGVALGCIFGAYILHGGNIGVIVHALPTELMAILGGSLGNLTDRMTREPGPGRGQVVDFIDYFGLFIGNVADIAIVGAALLIGLLALRGIGVDGRRPHHGRHEAAE